jgi:hypothetical protein
MEIFKNKYNKLLNIPSDINEHLSTLYNYASNCESVLELGVRGVISSWAISYGLLNNGKKNKKLFMNDMYACDINEILTASSNTDLEIEYKWINDLELDFNHNFDMVFIDTWHIYAQLIRELNKFSLITNKYIIMHDTTVDEWHGESVRQNSDALQESIDTGFIVEEIKMGLWPAIVQFLSTHRDWKLKERFTNNNGLTILERVHSSS